MLQAVRDVAIILLALETIVAFLILILVAWKIYQLVGFIRSKTEEFSALGRALMENARETAETVGETATTVKGSTEFLSDTVVTPVVQVVSAVAGARSFVAALFNLSGSRGHGGRK